MTVLFSLGEMVGLAKIWLTSSVDSWTAAWTLSAVESGISPLTNLPSCLGKRMSLDL